MNNNYHQILSFLNEIEQVKSTLRHNWTQTGRQESSAEHMWRATVFLLLAYETFQLPINLLKTIKMLLIHDIAELKHGDIPGFVKDHNQQKHTNHKKRERQVAKEIFSLLPKEIAIKYWNLFEEFEEGQTQEAKIAHAVEKMESQLQHLNSGPAYWNSQEKGKHMLTYPNESLSKATNSDLNKFWEIIKSEIEKLNSES